jgi:DNA repair exonuclease SbcCD ATPase subunit
MANESNIDPPEQTLPGSTPSGQTPTPQGQTPPAVQQKTSIDSLPSDIQDYIKRLRDEAEEANKLRKAEAKAKQQAEEARLKEQGEFKQLAEKHEARVKELEPISTRYTTLAELVSSQIEAQVKDWPAEVKTFDPGKDAPIEDRLAWINKSQPLIEKLQQQARAMTPGNAPGPRPAGGNSEQQAIEELRQRYRASGKYSAF